MNPPFSTGREIPHMMVPTRVSRILQDDSFVNRGASIFSPSLKGKNQINDAVTAPINAGIIERLLLEAVRVPMLVKPPKLIHNILVVNDNYPCSGSRMV